MVTHPSPPHLTLLLLSRMKPEKAPVAVLTSRGWRLLWRREGGSLGRRWRRRLAASLSATWYRAARKRTLRFGGGLFSDLQLESQDPSSVGL